MVVHAIQRPLPLADDAALATEATRFCTGNARMSPVDQLDVYREQFWLRHIGALAEDFRSIEVLLGDDAWRALCVAYLLAQPSRAYSLRYLGERFGAFVRREAPWRDDPLIGDLADLEWAFVDAWDAEDAPPLDAAKIGAIGEDAWPGARVILHPSVRALRMGWPGHVFRSAAKRDENPARPSPEETFVVVYRGAETLEYVDVDRDAWALLDRLARGTPLGPACEAVVLDLALDAAAFEGRVGAHFQSWTQRGWVVDVVTSA
jgi:hypothetical protein